MKTSKELIKAIDKTADRMQIEINRNIDKLVTKFLKKLRPQIENLIQGVFDIEINASVGNLKKLKGEIK